ncbi:hypothetical protein HEP87_61795 [Streptomyces sp. S1D4-11]
MHAFSEDLLGVQRDQRLQRDLDTRAVGRADEDSALRRDELVAQGGVGRLAVEAELFLGPMSAPGGGVEGGAGAEGAPGQVGERAAQGGAVQPGRSLRVLGVQPQADVGDEGVAVPVQDGPVDVEQSACRARSGTGLSCPRL